MHQSQCKRAKEQLLLLISTLVFQSKLHYLVYLYMLFLQVQNQQEDLLLQIHQSQCKRKDSPSIVHLVNLVVVARLVLVQEKVVISIVNVLIMPFPKILKQQIDILQIISHLCNSSMPHKFVIFFVPFPTYMQNTSTCLHYALKLSVKLWCKILFSHIFNPLYS